jgi:peptide-methionine (S)-S-oxide reductase
MIQKIGLGGGCHWCTEAVFQSLRGVSGVRQGWVAAREAPDYSEAILLSFDRELLPLEVLLHIHLSTHSSTSIHSMRKKYRSAVYVFSEYEREETEAVISNLQREFKKKIITRTLRFQGFRMNSEEYQDYYRKDPDKPFCRNVIAPKIRALLSDFGKWTDPENTSLPDRDI